MEAKVKYDEVKRKIFLVSRIFGFVLVVTFNAFIFITDYPPVSSPSLKLIAEFVDHASMEHHINESPFTLNLNFKVAPAHVMDAATSFPITLPQFTPAILWLMVFGLTICFICFCFFRGEKNMNTQFFPGILLPPPKYL
ncbi:MAG: hypothetical protein WBB36_06620 [Chitinophagales bacterium]